MLAAFAADVLVGLQAREHHQPGPENGDCEHRAVDEVRVGEDPAHPGRGEVGQAADHRRGAYGGYGLRHTTSLGVPTRPTRPRN